MGWVYTDSGGRQIPLLPEQVIHAKRWNPTNEFRGLGEIEAARMAAETDFLAGRYQNDVGRFNQVWGLHLASFDELLKQDQLAGPKSEAVQADREAFVALIADRYFGTLARAIREVDPEHPLAHADLQQHFIEALAASLAADSADPAGGAQLPSDGAALPRPFLPAASLPPHLC